MPSASLKCLGVQNLTGIEAARGCERADATPFGSIRHIAPSPSPLHLPSPTHFVSTKIGAEKNGKDHPPLSKHQQKNDSMQSTYS
ncbi:MAG: hypothetical protein IIW46_00215, partial [Bacteroidaceae bacterium]|nr:hypothetical protein [Bacteroidaceae bacterium]